MRTSWIKETLDKIKAEYVKALTAEEYGLRGDHVRKAKVVELRREIEYWETQLAIAEGRRRSMKMTSVVPVDV